MVPVRPMLLCVLLAAVACAVPAPQPAPNGPPPKHGWHLPHPHLPHLHMPHLSPKFKAGLGKVKSCIKAELVKLPGGVGHVMSNCLSSIASGPPAFGACVAGKGVMSAARATSHIAVCVG